MGHIFISYSHKDKKYVEKLEKKLIREGFDVWIDHRIDYGSQWPKEIQKALDICDAFIVVVSENAYQSEWVQNEVARAQRKGKPFFPLLLQGDPWLSVETIQYVDVQDGSLPSEKFYKHLVAISGGEKSFVTTSQNITVPEKSTTQKTVEFLEHYPKRDRNTDNFVCAFGFSVKETHLIGTPYESVTVHRLIVSLTDELVINWHLWGNDGGEGFGVNVLKVAFQSAEEHISFLIRSRGVLDKELEPLKRTTNNSPEFCPYKIANITYPANKTFVVGFDDSGEVRNLRKKLNEIESAQPKRNPLWPRPGQDDVGWNIKK